MKEISSRMKIEKKYALNKFFNLFVVLSLLCAVCAVALLPNAEMFRFGLVMGVLALLLIVVPAFFTPYCYAFDGAGVSFCYVFLPTERYLWKDVRAITVEDIHVGHADLFWDFFFSSVFHLKGKNLGKKRFYMTGNMRKSFRTKRLLEQYWDGEIEGLFWKDAKEWLSKCRGKKQAESKEYLTDEIVPMEREAQEKAEKWVVPFQQKAQEYGLALKTEYVYITEDFEELKSRPKEGYTYTLLIRISLPEETDENRTVEFYWHLIYVRLGKRAYRGVENEMAQEELNELGAMLNEIHQEGIDIYCEE